MKWEAGWRDGRAVNSACCSSRDQSLVPSSHPALGDWHTLLAFVDKCVYVNTILKKENLTGNTMIELVNMNDKDKNCERRAGDTSCREKVKNEARWRLRSQWRKVILKQRLYTGTETK